MKKSKKTSKMTWFLQHRLLVFIILIVVVLPLIMIPGIYISQHNQNKPVLFEDKSAKVVGVSDMAHFDIDYQITEMRETNSELSGGYYRVKFTLTKKDTVNSISNVKLTFQLSTTWEAYQSNSTEQTVALGQERTVQIAFNFDMDQNVLPFVKPGGPFLYAKITYVETILNEPFNRTVYVKLPMDLVKDNTTIIPA